MARLVALSCALTAACGVALFAASGAQATSTNDRVAAARHAVDQAAQRWFAAQSDATKIDGEIADTQRRIHDTESRVAAARKIATARAVMLYKSGDVTLSSVFASDVMDAARKAELAGQANNASESAIAQLTNALDDLHAQEHDLEQRRTRQQQILHDVAQQRDRVDAQLLSARVEAQREAQVALVAARDRAARARAAARVRALRSLPRISNTTAAPTLDVATHPAADTNTPRVAPTPVVSSGGSQHNDPFLACTRARESGGIYSINTGNGYYGAYQFLPSTWDIAAVHAGRMDLVGVLPSNASPADQDLLAWTLYQWQGKGPWGGRC